MAKTLANIQKSVKDIVQDEKAVFTDGFGRTMFNSIYRSLVAKFDWPELSKRSAITSQTVADQEDYTWTGTSFPVFLDIKSVEVESLSNDEPTTSSDVFGTSTLTEATARNTYKMIQQAPNEFEWNLAGRRASVKTPIWFKLYYTSATQVSLRPAPSITGYNIRVTGTIEPTELTTPAGTTIFLQSSADDALEHMLAAAWLFKLKNETQANIELQRAASRLNAVFQDEQITTETIKGLI